MTDVHRLAEPVLCTECGELCIDAGPGLGWQCVSRSPKHKSFVVVDRSDTRVNALLDEIEQLKSALRAIIREESKFRVDCRAKSYYIAKEALHE